MSRILALDEIIEQLGPPASVCWVDAPCGAVAAIARFRPRGAVVDLSASGTFRLIFQITDSQVETRLNAEFPSRRLSRVGSIITSFTLHPERIGILGAAETLHILFSPELAESLRADDSFRLSTRAEPALRVSAVQALVAMAQAGSESQLRNAVASVTQALARDKASEKHASGGLPPQASRTIHNLLDKHLWTGVSVPELAEAAGLSVHHFIKMCRQTEGFTPHALLLQKRMERAIALLANRRARVDEVAMMTGFSSPSHLVSTFRSLVGVTPAAFRNAVAP
jgi:AraC-like DNA-binding protein